MHLHFYPFSWWSVGGHLNIAISRKLTKTFPFVDGYMFVPCYIQSIPILSLLFFHVFPIICVCCTSNIRGSNSETLEGKHGFGRFFFRKTFHLQKKNHEILGFQVFVMGSILDWPQIRPQILRCLRPSPAAGDANASAQVWETVSETVADLKNPKRSEFSRGNHGKLWETIRSACFFGLISLMFNVFNCQIRLSGGISTSRCADSEDLFSMKSVIVFEV